MSFQFKQAVSEGCDADMVPFCSALDTTTEKDIQKALQNLLTGRSSLSIAHRLSTIANSDVYVTSYSDDSFYD